MKEEILKRAMFAMPLSKEAQNTGIMSGFDMEEELDEDENADLEEMPPMARTPQNPEILMNNLRGDVRSLDARYMELAQMVGEEAAMETPPEVLAMLMGQMGAQQAGIGALPQAQGMMPPGAGMPPPDQMGAPQPAPAMPQGGIPMPQGMESAPPFSQGAEAPQGYADGGEVAPPTPDGMPPMYAAAGAFASAYQRLAQQGARGVEALGRGAQSANQYLGNLLMAPQPTLQRMTGGTPAMNLSVQGRESLLQTPTGAIVQGTGTQAVPYMSMGPLTSPTFTQGLKTGVAQAAERFPRAAEALKTAFPVLGFGAAAMQSIGGRNQLSPEDAEKEARREALISQIPTSGYPEAPLRPGEKPRPPRPAAPVIAQETAAPVEAPAAAPAAAPADDLGAFITEKLGAFEKRQEGKAGTKEETKPKSRVERIREAQAEYAPLYEEILGSDKEAAKTNALLLLAEAGLKLASTRKPTFAMALGESFAGVPRGLAAIAAQERELGVKGKLGALERAIGDVESEDKYAQAVNLQFLKGDQEIQKKLADKKTNIVYENVGVGGRVAKDANGSYIGFGIDQRDPIVQDIRNNPEIATNFTSNNPFARDLGKATTATRESPKSREAALERFNLLSAQVANVDRALGMVENAFSPGTFVVNAVNNLVVPITPNFLVRPDVDKAAVISGLKNVFSDLTRGDAEIGGKISVQGEKWQRENLNTVADPDNFFKNPELAAKVYRQRKTDYLNEMYRVGTELGLFDRNIVVSTPPTGTRNDPFVIPKDPAEQQRMASYLQSAFSTARNPQSMIYMRDHKGDVVQVPINKFLNPKAGN